MVKKSNKNHSGKANPKAQAVDVLNAHEPIIQDRIAGLGIAEIAKKHSMHRDTISDICNKPENLERIKAERAIILADRQEKINRVLEDDIEQLTDLLTKSTRLMLTAVDKLQELIDKKDHKGKSDLKPGTLILAIDTATKAFDKVRSVTLAQQREASKE